jgi:ribosomal protein S25
LTAKKLNYGQKMKAKKRTTTKRAKGSANLAVALSPEVAQQLRDVAEKTGLPINAVARMSIEATIAMVKRDGGLFLPLAFPDKK